jgi:S-adenosylmethionine-diacylglycerol 3-amino-3-carboxypropyl transferase
LASLQAAIDTNHSVSEWACKAARMPIAFAQVREDARADLELLRHLPSGELRGMMIASGGCTAAALAASRRFSSLHLVDVNLAQLALCRLKLHLLQTATTRERMEVLGHAACAPDFRAAKLAEAMGALALSQDVLGPFPFVAERGPDQVGRYELLFAELRDQMRTSEDEWIAICRDDNATKRAARIGPGTTLGNALDVAFDRVMALPNLVHLFGSEATRNSREPFSRHFARRTRNAIADLPTHDNPYLWQMLLGRFPDGTAYPWLSAAAPQRMPRIVESVGTMDSALADCPGEFDFVHLSNILDWLSSEQAARTLQLSHQALRPGGYVIIRQLNSTLAIPAIGPQLEWLPELANDLHARDRSFFYRLIHVGRRA